MPTLAALGAILLWSTLATFGVALEHLPPLFLTGYALTLGALPGLPHVRRWRVPATTLLLGVGGLFGFHFLLFLALRPTRGLITLFGHDIATLSKDSLATLRRRIGIVFQDFRLLDHMTTYENVALPLRVMGLAEDNFRTEVMDLLDWVGLGERMSALPPVLSGGEKQRAAIARAVIARPQLLLADEPTGNVDPSLAQRLLRLFVELNKSGTAVVIATHDIALMDQFNARRLVLHEGRLHVYE